MFRIKSLELINHYKFGNINFEFSEDNIIDSQYFTIFIGPNGAGKSLILETLIFIFKTISEEQLKIFNNSNFEFKIEYYFDDVLYHYSNINSNITTNIASKKHFPKKIIANTFSANDRFIYLDKRRISELNYFEEAYEYQGLRTIANAIYKGTNLKRLLYSIINISHKVKRLENLQNLFNNIGFEHKVNFTLKAGNGLKIRHNDTKVYNFINDIKSFNIYFNELIASKYEKYSSRNNRYSYLDKYLKNEIVLKKSSEFLQKLLISNDFSLNRKSNLCYELDFNNLNSFIEIRDFAHSIELLTELDILGITDISFVKDNIQLGIYNTSSGEFNIISSIINIASKIENDSLILIDEPEISLHPEWQMKYINILKSAFENFNNVHFFISTHSHFILSDLFPTNSKILILYNQKNKVEIKYFNESTYAKSAEEILLEVFETPTTRNYYLSELVGNILEKMADPKIENKVIKQEIEKLAALNLNLLSDSDPLKEIVIKLVSKLG